MEDKRLNYRCKWPFDRFEKNGRKLPRNSKNPPELVIAAINGKRDFYGRVTSAVLEFSDGTVSAEFPYDKWNPANGKAVIASKYEKWLYVMRKKGILDVNRIPA